MEQNSKAVGMVYGDTPFMANSSDMELGYNKQPIGKENSFYRWLRGYSISNVFTPNSKKMAQAKVMWLLFHLLGGSSFLLSIMPPKWLADINIGQIDQPYRTILWVLAVIYMVTVIARSLEKWHHSHLVNREHRQRLREQRPSPHH